MPAMPLNSSLSGNAAPGGRRSLLRIATAASHRDLEDAMERRRYFECLDAYREYLLRLERFYSQFCQAMAQSESVLLNRWGLRDHQDWLASDLSHFHLTPLPADEGMPPALRIESHASAYGAAYVILGSSLGAKLLVSRAVKLVQGQGAGCTYLAALKSSSRHWSSFLGQLETEDDLEEAELLDGAIRTFSSYKAHMTAGLAQ